LNVFPIHIPALRQRHEDIALFLNFFLKKFTAIHSKKITGIASDVIWACEQYDWPGNVRELENVFQRAIILEKSPILTSSSFPQELFHITPEPDMLPNASWPTLAELRRKAIEHAEQGYLRSILAASHGRINQAAQIAGVSRRQIHKLLTRYGIDKKEFKI
jgi:DNA-binding NtrC family response regulator